MTSIRFCVTFICMVFCCSAVVFATGQKEEKKAVPGDITVTKTFSIRDLRDLVDEASHIPDRYQRYSRFLEIYETAPLEYWYQDGGMSHYLRLLCDALVFYGRADEAVPLLLNGFATAGSGSHYVFQRFLGRFESTYPVSRRIRGTPAFNRYLARAEAETAAASPDDKAAAFTATELFYYYLNRVYPLMQEGRDDEALSLIDKAESLARDYSMAPWELQFTELFRRALYFYREHDPSETRPIPFRWLGLFIPAVDAIVQNGDGTVRECRVRMEEQQIAERVLYNREQTDTASWLYYYLSGGQLWMDFEFRPIDSVLTGEIPADVIPEKLEPFPFDEMLDLYENYDGLIYLYPNELRPGIWTGGNTWPPLVPRILRSDRRQFTIWMRESGSWRTYIHEIFHNFEQVYGIKPSHGYLEANRNTWPPEYAAWVSRSGVPSELVYYEDRFSRVIVPEGLQPVLDRDKETPFTRAAWKRARDGFLAAAPGAVEAAWELHRRAIDLSRSDNPADAEPLWRQSLQKFDQIVDVYNWYADYLERSGRREEALALRKRAIEKCTGLPGMDVHYHKVLPVLIKEGELGLLKKYLGQMETLLPPAAFDQWKTKYAPRNVQ